MGRTVRTYDALLTNLCALAGPPIHVSRPSCQNVLSEIRGFVYNLGGHLGFGFDLPMLLLPSSTSQNRNNSHSSAPVHFRHSTIRASWFFGSLFAHRALLADLPWVPMRGWRVYLSHNLSCCSSQTDYVGHYYN